MQLKLKQLRYAVEKVIEDQKTSELLRTEAKRVLGHAIAIDADVSDVAKAALDIVESRSLTNVPLNGEFKLSALLKFSEHSDANVRKLAAKLLPKKNVNKLLEDVDADVRFAAASRLSSSQVKNLIDRTGDESYVDLYENKLLSEAKEDKLETKLTGDVVKTQQGPELSKHFYDTLAARFLQDYGKSLFANWKLAAKRYVSSVKATSMVDIDLEKLTKAIEDAVKARDEEMYEPLKETIKRLRGQPDVICEERDPIVELLNTRCSAIGYMQRFEKLYVVSLKTLCESKKSERVPLSARTKDGTAVTDIDERAFDRYVEAWNKRSSMLSSTTVKLQWHVDSSDASRVKFTVTE